MMEGTVAGMAAAAAAPDGGRRPRVLRTGQEDKRLCNGVLRDIALIDAVVSDDFYAGAKAIWDPRAHTPHRR